MCDLSTSSTFLSFHLHTQNLFQRVIQAHLLRPSRTCQRSSPWSLRSASSVRRRPINRRSYWECAFVTPGTGQFRGVEGSNPTIGKAGELEYVEEDRVEVLVTVQLLSKEHMRGVVAALKNLHPHEPHMIFIGWKASERWTHGHLRVFAREYVGCRSTLLGRHRKPRPQHVRTIRQPSPPVMVRYFNTPGDVSGMLYLKPSYVTRSSRISPCTLLQLSSSSTPTATESSPSTTTTRIA